MAETVSKAPMIDVKPLGDRQILRVPQRKGFVRRLVRDDPARIEELEELGYKTVASPDGGPLRRYEYVVMEIPSDLYEARQAAKVEQIKRERQIVLNAAARRDLSEQVNAAPRGKTSVIGGVELEKL